MKRTISIAFCLMLSTSLMTTPSVHAKVMKLKLATVVVPHHAYNEGAREFARRIKEATGGAIDIIAAVCAMNENTIPAAVNCEHIVDGCNLNIVTKLQEKEVNYVLCCSYTYGGQTAAVVLKKVK